MLRITKPEQEELKVEIQLGDEIKGPYRVDDAAELLLLYTDCARGKSIPEAYESFRVQASLRFGHEISAAMAFAIIEAISAHTMNFKKKHISMVGSKSLESTPVESPPAS